MYTFQAIQVFIFLIPGFISSRLLNSLTVREKEQKDLETIIEALIFSMVIYTLYTVLGYSSPISFDQQNNTVKYIYEMESFLILIAISILLPIFIALINNNSKFIAMMISSTIQKSDLR